jgi:hypothetical protein
MASIWKQTLYAASGRAVSSSVTSGVTGGWVAQTEAQTYNNSNTNYDVYSVRGDENTEVGIADAVCKWTLDSCTYSGIIDFVRVRVKANKQDIDAIVQLRPYCHEAVQGNGISVTDNIEWYNIDLLINPFTSLAWVNAAAVNAAGKWGWGSHNVGAYIDSGASIIVYEFEVQVWGPETTVESGGRVHQPMATLVGASWGTNNWWIRRTLENDTG